jgi:Flp pilus assembly pilin Flp
LVQSAGGSGLSVGDSDLQPLHPVLSLDHSDHWAADSMRKEKIEPIKGEKIMKNALRKLWSDEEGMSTVEYVLIASVMAVIIIAAFSKFREEIIDVLDEIFKNFKADDVLKEGE